ncbi:hypothetical protein [Promicromonospora sp. AC04]|uniref:hypothetical protein n=1 Tax=Promicromonospora sp. AC04 TaxID=2135723 RepID=UPI0011B20522|nr:hypothetical protein [Promicromonospora sp. AC04]
MSLTRRLHPFLAGPRRGSVSVLTVMLLVLAAVTVHALCSFHLDPHTSAQAHDGGEVLAAQGVANTQDAAVEVVPEPLGGASHGCSDRHSAAVQCDPVLPPSLVLAALPEPAVQRLAPVTVHRDHRTASSVAVAAAPSLHALGISRT